MTNNQPEELKIGDLVRLTRDCYGVRAIPTATLMIVGGYHANNDNAIKAAYLTEQDNDNHYSKTTVSSGKHFYIDKRVCEKI
jgi:hypothetical protein